MWVLPEVDAKMRLDVQDIYWRKCPPGKTEGEQVEAEGPADRNAGLSCLKEAGKERGLSEQSSSARGSEERSNRLSGSS